MVGGAYASPLVHGDSRTSALLTQSDVLGDAALQEGTQFEAVKTEDGGDEEQKAPVETLGPKESAEIIQPQTGKAFNDPSEAELPNLYVAPPPASKEETKPAPKTEKNIAQSSEPWGASSFTTGAAQVGLGLVVATLLASTGPFSCILGPALSSVSQVLLGDMLGQRRGAWFPTLAAVFVAQNVLSALNNALFVAGYFGGYMFLGIGTLVLSSNAPAVGLILVAVGASIMLSAFAGILPAAFMFTAVAQTAGALAYHFSGEEKRAGDTGDFHVPGLISPRHPQTSATLRIGDENARKQAMAY